MHLGRTFLSTLALAASLAAGLALPVRAGAADDPLAAAVHRIETQWETIKFTLPDGSEQGRQMDALGAEADALAAQYPARVEALIWDGIITSERASMANPISGLSLAKQARATLEKAYKLDPAALDGGAPATLGVLYYRVPGFPLGFGDNSKAAQLLEQAAAGAPNGLDAWYFYGDFLMTRGDYAKAKLAFTHALAIPPNAERPLWDKNRRLVIAEKLAAIKAKS